MCGLSILSFLSFFSFPLFPTTSKLMSGQEAIHGWGLPSYLGASVMMPTNARYLVPSSVLFLLLHTVQTKHIKMIDANVLLHWKRGWNNNRNPTNRSAWTLENTDETPVVEYLTILMTKRRLSNRVLEDRLLDKGTSQNPMGIAFASERLWNIWGGICCQTSTCDICMELEGKEASSSDKYCGEHGLRPHKLLRASDVFFFLSSVPVLSLILLHQKKDFGLSPWGWFALQLWNRLCLSWQSGNVGHQVDWKHVVCWLGSLTLESSWRTLKTFLELLASTMEMNTFPLHRRDFFFLFIEIQQVRHKRYWYVKHGCGMVAKRMPTHRWMSFLRLCRLIPYCMYIMYPDNSKKSLLKQLTHKFHSSINLHFLVHWWVYLSLLEPEQVTTSPWGHTEGQTPHQRLKVISCLFCSVWFQSSSCVKTGFTSFHKCYFCEKLEIFIFVLFIQASQL